MTSRCQTSNTPNVTSNTKVIKFNFSNHVESVVATKRAIKTILYDNPRSEIKDPTSSLKKNGEHLESNVSQDPAVLSPGMISHIKVRKNVS